MVVLARVFICNTRVKDKTTLVGHATACWAKIRPEDRHMVMVGYDTYPDKEMWSIMGFMDAGDARTDTPNNYLDTIRCSHGSASLLGWLPVVCPMTYDCGADINMILRDPLSVPFHMTYTDGLLHYIQYIPEEDSQTMCNDWKRKSVHDKETHSSSEAASPDGGKDVERPDEENLNGAGCGDVEQGMGDAEPSARLQQGMGGAEPSARLEQGMGVVEPSARLKQGMGGAEPCARLKERMGGAEPSARSDDMMMEKTKKQKCGVSKGKGNAPAVGDTKVPTKRKAGVAKRRRHPGQATLAEIRHLQRSVHLCLPFTPFLRLVREIVNKDVAPGRGIRFELVGMCALLEAAEAYLMHLMENTNELAIHAKRVTVNVKDMRLADALWKPRRNKQRRTSSMSLSAEEVQSALSQVMKYATKGVHYDSNMELEMLKERVSAYFSVKLDIHRTIAANGDKATTALHLLDRLKRTRAARSGSQTEESAYNLNGIVD
ncbi:hypothetical protein CBR_g46306 [Chara braunii]|uniref:Core Histone H2A/H2B/H3 domain-containing protein n=1 Tax=Chara braunii TaxID=69332 RepID=A0A388M040_CHABU|nr:hypothetical protein CBR_g46306 [Chara braunii]|eukprot:GBG87940.1 hypothetical protein CBR_g46306 [Chara braunii]